MTMTDDPRRTMTQYDIKNGKLREKVEGKWFPANEPAHGVKILTVSGPTVRVLHFRMLDPDGVDRVARRITMKTTGETWWEWEE